MSQCSHLYLRPLTSLDKILSLFAVWVRFQITEFSNKDTNWVLLRLVSQWGLSIIFLTDAPASCQLLSLSYSYCLLTFPWTLHHELLLLIYATCSSFCIPTKLGEIETMQEIMAFNGTNWDGASFCDAKQCGRLKVSESNFGLVRFLEVHQADSFDLLNLDIHFNLDKWVDLIWINISWTKYSLDWEWLF